MSIYEFNKYDNIPLCEILKKLIIKSGRSQLDIALAINKTPATISNLSLGKTALSIEMSRLLGAYFNLHPDYLYRYFQEYILHNTPPISEELKADIAACRDGPKR